MDSYAVSSELPCVLPYRGEFGETADFSQVGENAGDRERFLAMLLRDPHLAELDHDLNFAEMIHAAQGRRYSTSRAFWIVLGSPSIRTFGAPAIT